MVYEIESTDDQSLVLIEEIENGLHPVATRRLVEYLIDVAIRKRSQIIFTTHSNDALLPLPYKAIWVAMRSKVFQGKLDISSLRAITGQVSKKLVVFVEDNFARIWVESIIRKWAGDILEQVEVHAMEGDGTAVTANRYHNGDPSIRVPSICILDGDSNQESSTTKKIFRLPGDAPESYIFDSVLERWDNFGGKLSVALLKEFSEAEQVKNICESVRRTNKDHHVLYSQIGEKIGLIPEGTVSSAFCTIWSQSNEALCGEVIKNIRDVLDSI